VVPGYSTCRVDPGSNRQVGKKGKSCLYINKLADLELLVLEELIMACLDDLRKKWPLTG
jgi:hypothetical protein